MRENFRKAWHILISGIPWIFVMALIMVCFLFLFNAIPDTSVANAEPLEKKNVWISVYEVTALVYSEVPEDFEGSVLDSGFGAIISGGRIGLDGQVVLYERHWCLVETQSGTILMYCWRPSR